MSPPLTLRAHVRRTSAQMLGPALLGLYGDDSHHIGWVVSGCLQFVATMNLLLVAGKISRATKWQVPLSPPRRRAAPTPPTPMRPHARCLPPPHHCHRPTRLQAGELSSKLRGGAKQALALAKLQEMQRAHNLDAYDESGQPCPREAKAQAPICYVGNCG